MQFKKYSCYLAVLPLVFATIHTKAQKGLPAKEKFTATVGTNYPAHVDFKENMVNNIKVPAGFKVAVAATGLGKPRIMAVREDGSMYVTRRDVGDVLLLSDKNGDGRFDDLKTVWTKFPDVHGITIHDGFLYLASSKELKRAKIQPDGMLQDTTTLFKDMPDGGQHDNRMLGFGPDGMLYITVGSDCNDCAETNPENATLLQVKPDGSSRRIFARGLRNTIGFDWQPVTKEIWACDMGTDWRGDEIPPEELNRIVDGGHYGWPQVYGKQQVDVTREDPLGTTKEAFAKTTIPAVMTFPAHSAPIDFKFIGNIKGFPQEYKEDALVTWHGSWNRSKPEGYKVQRIHFVNGKPISVDDFFTGFLNNSNNTRFGRPVALAYSNKGDLYISDDENGVIYRVYASR